MHGAETFSAGEPLASVGWQPQFDAEQIRRRRGTRFSKLTGGLAPICRQSVYPARARRTMTMRLGAEASKRGKPARIVSAT